MKTIRLSDIERVFANSASSGDIQTMCRQILINQFEESDFPNSISKNLIMELCGVIGFPINFGVKTEKSKQQNSMPMYTPLICGCLGVASLFMPKVIDSLVAISTGIGIGYYFAKRNLPEPEHSYLVINTTAREVMNYITVIGQLLLKFANSDALIKDNYSLLSWLRDLFVKCKKEGNKEDLMDEIQMILLKNGYKLVDYSDEYASCFKSSLAKGSDITEPKTIYPGVMNINTKNFVSHGEVVFPK